MPGKNLTRDEAATRAALIDVSGYDVELDLTTGPTTFRSVSTISFSCRTPGATTFVDFIGDSVDRVVLNGVELDPADHFADSRIQLSELAVDNVLVVDATARYTNSGEGLHRFVDPVDERVYLYSQFEVPDSRRMFAVFEQPDLKARFRFTVTAPADWTVISNSPTPQPTPAERTERTAYDGQIATWRFEPTPRISSYVTALCAGGYVGVTDEVQTRAGTIPLGVYCRASLAEYLDADNIFDVTKRGFAFFEEEFDCAYPFAKYDQIFAPEYNMGAMENVGCVTIAEIYIFRAKVSEAIVERRALTILHELAHMWFGDLVTMRWWDDLWLNESFAEWASTTCQAEATDWTSAWTTFGTAEKTWAYNQDQLSSTHPIAADMRHLEDVEVNFDGITYAKGASVLKQLVAYVGRDAFRKAVQEYFATHAWGNTELADLLRLLEKHSGRDLASWSTLWLQTAGVNTVEPEFTVENGRYTSFAVLQRTPAEWPTQRPHRIGIGRYAVQGDRLVRVGYDEVDIDGPRTELPEFVGVEQPDLLLVNDEDLAYAKIRLDARSLATALAYPHGFTDTLPRSLVLGALWDMARDAQMRARDYVDYVLEVLSDVEDSTMLRVLLSLLATSGRLYVAPDQGGVVADRISDRLRVLAADAAPGGDGQLQLVQAFCSWAHRDVDADWLEGLLSGSVELPGLAMDSEMRWAVLIALAATGRADEADISQEAGRDDTATGRERAATALAARPTAEAKALAWTQGVRESDLPNQMLVAVGQGFGKGPEELLEPYVAEFHAAVRGAWEGRSVALGERVVLYFYPIRLANRALLQATENWLTANEDAPAGLHRLMVEHRDTVRRALAAQANDGAA